MSHRLLTLRNPHQHPRFQHRINHIDWNKGQNDVAAFGLDGIDVTDHQNNGKKKFAADDYHNEPGEGVFVAADGSAAGKPKSYQTKQKEKSDAEVGYSSVGRKSGQGELKEKREQCANER